MPIAMVALAPYEIELLADRMQEEIDSATAPLISQSYIECRIFQLRQVAANARAGNCEAMVKKGRSSNYRTLHSGAPLLHREATGASAALACGSNYRQQANDASILDVYHRVHDHE